MKGWRRRILKTISNLYIAEGYRKCVSIAVGKKGWLASGINTGYIPPSDAVYEVIVTGLDSKPIFFTDNFSFVIGEAGYFVREIINGSNVFRLWIAHSGINHFIVGNNYLYDCITNKVIVNGTPIDFANGATLKFFGSYAPPMAYFSVKVDGKLVKEYYPAYEEATGKYGLYEMLEKKFFKSENGVDMTGILLDR